MNRAKGLSLLNQASYLLFFISLICSFRAVSSISIGLILLIGILNNKSGVKILFHRNLKNSFLAACLLFYLLCIISLLYTHNIHEGWSNIRLKSGLLFTPLAVCCSHYINTDTRKKLFSQYCLLLAAASLYCLLTALFHYWKTADLSHFFYHALVSPFKQHAVYFSIYVFIALLFLLESLNKNDLVFNKLFHAFLTIFFSVFIFLLSSKLVIAFYFLYLLYYFIGLVKNNATNRALIISLFILLIITGSLVLIIRNPVSERFHEVAQGDLTIVKQDKYEPGRYFNGVEFRLIQWKFVAEILNENHRWWIGVSPGDAQLFLDQKYISTKMYTGDPAKGKRGFLGYNTHNQFLETLLQTGITGLFILLIICASLIQMAWQKKSRTVSFIIILLLAWLFSESAFETQYGILLFTFFPLFVCPDENQIYTRPGEKLSFS
jgi:O-antigen ligase